MREIRGREILIMDNILKNNLAKKNRKYNIQLLSIHNIIIKTFYYRFLMYRSVLRGLHSQEL